MNRIASALVAALLLTGSAQAQGYGPRPTRVERSELRDDRRDLEDLRNLLARFDAAWSSRSERQMANVEVSLRKLLRAELAESERELSKDRAQSRRTRRDARVAQWGGPGQPCGAVPPRPKPGTTCAPSTPRCGPGRPSPASSTKSRDCGSPGP